MSVETNERTRHRMELDFSSEAFSTLQQIKEQSDAASNAEVVRNALRMHEWYQK